jgi:methanogenic corrinoid protein MtbC1
VYNPDYSRRWPGAWVEPVPPTPVGREAGLRFSAAEQAFSGSDAAGAAKPRSPWREPAQEVGMQGGSPRHRSTADCAPAADTGSWTRDDGRALWSTLDAGMVTAKERLARLARTLESDVIPRLVQLHRSGEAVEPVAAAPGVAEVERFVAYVAEGSEAQSAQVVDELRRRGMSIETVYLKLLAPAARRLGELWTEDRCDFSTVTVGLGRLQRLMRELSPAFGSEVEHPPNGRRVLLTQADDEQHSFGLCMVAEFFRRAGWEVQGGVAGSGIDAVASVRRDWYDAVGFSVGIETRLDWVAGRIAALRRASRNSGVVVLVGGPVFALHPDWHDRVGADVAVPDGSAAPSLAESLLASRAQSEPSSSARPG